MQWLPRLALVLTVIVGLACAKSAGDGGGVAVPEDFQLRIGQGGGITGLWNGHTVGADGTVSAWEGRSERAEPTDAGSIPETACASLWREVQEASFFELDASAPGNMTRVLEVTAGGRTHTTRWELGHADFPTLDALYTSCEATIRDALAQQ